MAKELVPMPPNDGAPFNCDLAVPKPRPVFWDACGYIGIEAYYDEDTELYSIRCANHQGITKDSL